MSRLWSSEYRWALSFSSRLGLGWAGLLADYWKDAGDLFAGYKTKARNDYLRACPTQRPNFYGWYIRYWSFTTYCSIVNVLVDKTDWYRDKFSLRHPTLYRIPARVSRLHYYSSRAKLSGTCTLILSVIRSNRRWNRCRRYAILTSLSLVRTIIWLPCLLDL